MNYDALFDIFTSSSSTATAITTETNFAKHVAARRGSRYLVKRRTLAKFSEFCPKIITAFLTLLYAVGSMD